MGALQRFVAILAADLRARTRTSRFWVVLVAMMYAAWWCVPGPDASHAVLLIWGGFRGSYSSAWIGMVLAMAFNVLLNLGGFYLVRGTLVRDIETRVWQLLVATPMTRAGYLLAKWASHMLVFLTIIVACLGVGLVAQWVRAEDRTVDLLELVKPVVLLTLPGLAMTAAIAIWFDLLPPLRRTAGNVLFFVLWTTALAFGVAGFEAKSDFAREGWVSDSGGLLVAGRDFHRVREKQTGKPQRFGFSLFSPVPKGGIKRFDWREWHVRPMDLFGRLLWLVFGIGAVLLAAPLLDRAAARTSATNERSRTSGLRLRWMDVALRPFARTIFGAVAVAELTACVRERRIWWWLALAVVFGLQAFGGEQLMRTGMLLAWLLPLDVLARGILREREHRTGALVFTGEGAVPRLLASRLVVSVLMLVGVSLPALLRLGATSPAGALAAVVVIVSIASCGIAFGALFRTARPFELALVALVYVALQGATVFDAGAGATLLGHLAAIALASIVVVTAWPRLARASV
ncbi:ABC transporter permease [Cognatilysobacter lacus]|uniref:ABC transporter permease n=1 Tax=Cognatilysobacter lacus TaxID=1643323 RepID=A0A5D8ZC08_9GAMM|nr:ABC transporter permease [Lysobacter lacus]TZF90204.1 ABC transporter permease [Lysobacter lacus]